ncbi:MAG: hypothetical protein JO007_15115 [Alphaproteobacteria bacterium]|nr:hypothetical protein [Alphaproteobacteria bacterium]
MTRHSYPSSAMIGDYLRATAGFCPAVAILASASVGPVATAVFVSIAALFALFGLRTGLRHATRFEATETGLSALGPLAATILWAELDRMELAYYSTRRDRRDGWMQLELRAGTSSIRLDSRVDGFEQLVERSALAAALRGIELSSTTAANLQALGLRTSGFYGASAAEGRA